MNSITLPSLPSVAERIQRVYRGRETDIDAVVHILISYPDVARKIKNVARCAGNDNLRAVEKIRFSLDKLGLRAVYCIIMTYAVGRRVEYGDHPTIRKIVRDAESEGYRWSDFVLGVVLSDPFRFRPAPVNTADAPRNEE